MLRAPGVKQTTRIISGGGMNTMCLLLHGGVTVEFVTLQCWGHPPGQVFNLCAWSEVGSASVVPSPGMGTCTASAQHVGKALQRDKLSLT
eukprot:s2187_g4.t1